MSAPLRLLRFVRNPIIWSKARNITPVLKLHWICQRQYCEDTNDEPKDQHTSSLNLAKPGKAYKEKISERVNKNEEMYEELKKAIHKVAEVVAGDKEQVTTELLHKLRAIQELTEESKGKRDSENGKPDVMTTTPFDSRLPNMNQTSSENGKPDVMTTTPFDSRLPNMNQTSSENGKPDVMTTPFDSRLPNMNQTSSENGKPDVMTTTPFDSRLPNMNQTRERSPETERTSGQKMIKSDDPKLQMSRLFIQKNPSITHKKLKDIFSTYGDVLAIKNFKKSAYVQFATEEIARKAISEEYPGLYKKEIVGDKKAAVKGKNNKQQEVGERGLERSPETERISAQKMIKSNDPKLRMSRLFIVKNPRITQKNLMDIFSTYGDVLAINSLETYAFVQFATEEIARKAISEEYPDLYKKEIVGDHKAALKGKNNKQQEVGERGLYAPTTENEAPPPENQELPPESHTPPPDYLEQPPENRAKPPENQASPPENHEPSLKESSFDIVNKPLAAAKGQTPTKRVIHEEISLDYVPNSDTHEGLRFDEPLAAKRQTATKKKKETRQKRNLDYAPTTENEAPPPENQELPPESHTPPPDYLEQPPENRAKPPENQASPPENHEPSLKESSFDIVNKPLAAAKGQTPTKRVIHEEISLDYVPNSDTHEGLRFDEPLAAKRQTATKKKKETRQKRNLDYVPNSDTHEGLRFDEPLAAKRQTPTKKKKETRQKRNLDYAPTTENEAPPPENQELPPESHTPPPDYLEQPPENRAKPPENQASPPENHEPSLKESSFDNVNEPLAAAKGQTPTKRVIHEEISLDYVPNSDTHEGLRFDEPLAAKRQTPTKKKKETRQKRNLDYNTPSKEQLMKFDEMDEPWSVERKTSIRKKSQQNIDLGSDYSLFGDALGIFSKRIGENIESTERTSESFFDELQRKERERTMYSPPTNAFQQEIIWTKEGKMWKFPVDNEEGMEEEAEVGFHEHIFFDELINEHFPATGPVRHFIELVAVGLSKNPYITAQQKRDHLMWFSEYFQDKYEIIDNLEVVTANE